MTVGGFVRARRTDLVPPSGMGWIKSELLLSCENVKAIENCLGIVVMSGGTVSPDAVRHETDELMFVVTGLGELHTEAGVISLSKGDAVFIPAHAWHWLMNIGEDDLISVFSFSSPSRPVSQTRAVTSFPIARIHPGSDDSRG
jgi:mannose-6-phosphate isomerase-like protein (cupin superfamily)